MADQSPESVVVTKTVRLVAPYVYVFGLFTMFHGASSVGGGFQGGVVVAAVVVTIAFAFGLDQAGSWLDRSLVTAATATGVLGFALVGLLPLLSGGTVLELGAIPGAKSALYAVEVVELGIGVTVAATIVVLFFELSEHDGEGGGE